MTDGGGRRTDDADLQYDRLLATRSSLLAPRALPVGFTPGRPSFAEASSFAKATADKTAGRRAPATRNRRRAGCYSLFDLIGPVGNPNQRGSKFRQEFKMRIHRDQPEPVLKGKRGNPEVGIG